MLDRIKGKEILVVGMARSGMAAVRLLAAMGAAKITITDQKPSGELQAELAQLSRYAAVTAVTGENPPDLVTDALSMIIKSPGVPPFLELFKRARELNVPIISEIELAYAFIKAPLIGVTGTNGKTTTTALITAMLKEARFYPVVAAGNIGNPLSDIVGKVGSQGIIVAELSSFQLEDINHFRPMVAVYLNFSEDHLDYHGSLERYFLSKARIIENQTTLDYAVFNAGDQAVVSLGEKARGSVFWFGQSAVQMGVGLEKDWVTIYNNGCETQKVCLRSEIALPGEHNLENALAASAAAWAIGADLASIRTVLCSFRAIEHRLEFVANLNGVEYINDSKGTNPEATIKALQSFPNRSKVLIAGGKDKGSDFLALAAVIKKEVKFLVLLGETKDKLTAAVEQVGFFDYQKTVNLEEAVEVAKLQASPGDLVLLSPACASWDMFTDYESRGNLFKELVRAKHRPQDKSRGIK